MELLQRQMELFRCTAVLLCASLCTKIVFPLNDCGATLCAGSCPLKVVTMASVQVFTCAKVSSISEHLQRGGKQICNERRGQKG